MFQRNIVIILLMMGLELEKNLEDLIMAIKKDILKQYNIKIEKEVCIY
ncbi:MAG: hypothetical protein Ct9H90mP3_7620 [Flammeovirgaceae bacterium]|nr:MAG: hypothetical protein Ct9H90mP3_7620 [Flammeovirgaceae bacterium]